MTKEKNPYLEALGQYATQKSSNLNLGGSPLAAGVNIAQQDFKNRSETRNEHDDDADLFAAIGAAAGPKPRGAAALFSGFAKGLEHGSRSKSTAKKQEALDKYDRVMNYFRETTQEATKRNEWYQKREFAQKKYLPQVLTYTQNADKLDSQSRIMWANNLMDGYNREMDTNYKIVSADANNYNLFTMRNNEGQIELLDLTNLMAGDETAQALMTAKMPEFMMKQQEAREQRQFENDIKERQLSVMEGRLAVEEENAPLKYETQNRRIDETSRRNDQTAIKEDVKLSETLGKKIDASREFLTIAPKMEDIVKNHPDIFQSAIDAVWRENKEPGFISNMTKDLQNKWNPEKVAALTSMVKYINKMTLDVANGFARPNMFIEKIGSKAVPNLDMNPQGFLNVLHEMIDENKTSIKNNQERFDLLQSDVGTGISDQYRRSTADVMGGANMSSPLPENLVTVKDPATGEQIKISKNDLDAAISHGLEPIG